MTQPSGFGPLKAADPIDLGRYRLLGRIGSGGMGVVYLGRSTKGLAAIKMIRHELADDPGFRNRFLRELQACHRVSGACTVRLLDFDVTADPPWLATEYVDAPNLEQLIAAGGPIGHPAQLALALGLADALVTLHEEGITHRDLKPSNVLCPDNGVKVIDFGIAAADDTTSLTGTSQVIGTPAWMAPERFAGGKATAACDIFAWAGLVSYAASGWQPFSGDSAKVMFSILRGEPDVDYSLLAPALREPVAAAFALDPQERPTAAGLRSVLSRQLSDGIAPATEVTGQLTGLLRAGWDGEPDVVDRAPDPHRPPSAAGPVSADAAEPASVAETPQPSAPANLRDAHLADPKPAGLESPAPDAAPDRPTQPAAEPELQTAEPQNTVLPSPGSAAEQLASPVPPPAPTTNNNGAAAALGARAPQSPTSTSLTQRFRQAGRFAHGRLVPNAHGGASARRRRRLLAALILFVLIAAAVIAAEVASGNPPQPSGAQTPAAARSAAVMLPA